MKNKEIFTKYAELKRQEDKIKEQMAEIKPLVYEAIEDLPRKTPIKLPDDMGTLYVGEKRTWEFSDEVKRAKDRVSEIQKEEKQKGIAYYSINKFVTYEY
jgi:hypothetical protein